MKIQIRCASAYAQIPNELGQPTVSGHGWAIFAKVEETLARRAMRNAKSVRILGDSYLITL